MNYNPIEVPVSSEIPNYSVDVVFEGSEDQPIKESMSLRVGNSGVFIQYFKKDHSWFLHFRPNKEVKPVPEKRIEFVRMFAVGFLSLIDFLLTSPNQDLQRILKDTSPNSVIFNTNDIMWNFAVRVLGEKYFRKRIIDFSKMSQKQADAIRLEIKVSGLPGYFNLAQFLEDYKANPQTIGAYLHKLACV